MNTKQKISIVTLVGVALAVSYWTGYVHGSSTLAPHEMIISMALPIILIWTLVTLTFGLFFKRDSAPTSSGGSQPPTGPFPGVPTPRPPGAPPDIYCEQLPNESLEPNCRGAGPLMAQQQLGRPLYARRSRHAAVAQVNR